MSSTPTSPASDARANLRVGGADVGYYRLDAVSDRLAQLPFTVKVLLENTLRNSARGTATAGAARPPDPHPPPASEDRAVPQVGQDLLPGPPHRAHGLVGDSIVADTWHLRRCRHHPLCGSTPVSIDCLAWAVTPGGRCV